MTKQQKELSIVALLLVVLVVMGVRTMNKMGTEKREKQKAWTELKEMQKADVVPEEETSLDGQEASLDEEEALLDDVDADPLESPELLESDVRDPFLAPITLVAYVEKEHELLRIELEKNQKVAEEEVEVITIDVRPPSLLVKGIIWGADAPQAIIGSDLVTVGDHIDGSRIVAIDDQGVHVEHMGKVFILNVQKAGQKGPSSKLLNRRR